MNLYPKVLAHMQTKISKGFLSSRAFLPDLECSISLVAALSQVEIQMSRETITRSREGESRGELVSQRSGRPLPHGSGEQIQSELPHVSQHFL